MNKRIKIGDRYVGIEEPAFIIADVGSNHDRKLSQAKKLIDVGSDCGVDAIKFQIYRTETFYSKADPMYALFKHGELPQEWIGELADYAKNRGIIFLATPFDKESVDILYETGASAFKWASSEIVNLPLLRHAASMKKPMLVSTGMSDMADIQEAIDIIHSTGNEDIVLLQCTSLYPTKPNQVNLQAMDAMKSAFNLLVGFSDHTLSTAIPAAAVARGACVIEKHITLSRSLKGPDHPYAFEPDEFKQMVGAIREVEESLGSPIKKMHPEEKRLARRNSIIAKVDIPAGSKITKDMVVIKRPAYGIKPKYLDIIIGSEAKRDIEKDEAITWEMI